MSAFSNCPLHCARVHGIYVHFPQGTDDCTRYKLSGSDWQRIKKLAAITGYDCLDLRSRDAGQNGHQCVLSAVDEDGAAKRKAEGDAQDLSLDKFSHQANSRL